MSTAAVHSLKLTGSDLSKLDVTGNPLRDTPNEILAQGDETLIMYLRDRHAGGLEKVYRMRLMVLGQEDVTVIMNFACFLNPLDRKIHSTWCAHSTKEGTKN